MNDRIRQLWSQAGGHYNSGNQHTWPEYTIDDPEKFSELMTTEFIGLLEYEIAMLEKYKTTSCNDSDRRWHEGKIVHFRRMIDKTKDHFGVE